MSERRSYWKILKFSESVEVNPRVPLTQGKVYSFIDMPSVCTDRRDPSCIISKVYRGGGSKFRRGDSIIAKIEPCYQNGKKFFFTQDEFGFGSTEFLVFRPKSSIMDSSFLFYYLQSPKIKERFEVAMAGTSGRRRIDTSFLSDYSIHIPPYEEQLRISCLLGKIDDAIAVNEQLNHNLAPRLAA